MCLCVLLSFFVFADVHRDIAAYRFDHSASKYGIAYLFLPKWEVLKTLSFSGESPNFDSEFTEIHYFVYHKSGIMGIKPGRRKIYEQQVLFQYYNPGL